MPWFAILDASTQPLVAAALGVNATGTDEIHDFEFDWCDAAKNASTVLSLVLFARSVNGALQPPFLIRWKLLVELLHLMVPKKRRQYSSQKPTQPVLRAFTCSNGRRRWRRT